MFPSLSLFLGNLKYSILRQKSLQTLDKMTARLGEAELLSLLPQGTVSELKDSLMAITDRQNKTLAATILQRLTPSS